MTNHRKTLKTVPDVIKALGGPTKAAKWTGLTPPAICAWASENFVPPAWHLRLWLHLEASGYIVTFAAFGIKDAKGVIGARKLAA
jgi:hypothetical protein